MCSSVRRSKNYETDRNSQFGDEANRSRPSAQFLERLSALKLYPSLARVIMF